MSLDLNDAGSVDSAVASAAALDAYSSVVTSVAARLVPSVVSIRVEHDADGRGTRSGGGSAIVLTPDGFLLTSAHVTERSRHTTIVFATGEEVGAKVVGSDRHSDLAVVRCDASAAWRRELAASRVARRCHW